MKNVMRLCLIASFLMTVAHAQQPSTPSTPAAGGQPAPQPRRIEAALAREAVEAAIAHCAGQNLKVSAAVVDAGGNPIYVFVPDGTSARTGDIAIRKGVTMSITGKAASETAALAAADPALEAKLVANPRTVRFPGGVPMKAGDTIVGFIAASGATGAQDEVCARAGADKIAARIK
jgi:glc operon protein GlcG